MSEEILKALMQLFAIISKQDMGSTRNQRDFVSLFLASQLNAHKVNEYLRYYDEQNISNDTDLKDSGSSSRLTSMKDSVRTLSICRKINKTLTHKQKVIVLIRLFEMLMSDQLFTEQRMGIIRTVATVFNIQSDEVMLIDNFIKNDKQLSHISQDGQNIGNLNAETGKNIRVISQAGLDNVIIILRIKSADLYFIRYNGTSELLLNGLAFNTKKIYLFPQGSTLRIPRGAIYYNDVVSRFISSDTSHRLSFRAENISYEFPGKVTGLRDVNIQEEFGLIGIMGASGSGKTTLLNVLSGIEPPFTGTVTINGIDVHHDVDEAKSLIGYIAQDDFLIEDLTVFENLYYNSKLCFRDLTKEEIIQKVEKVLTDLGLFEIKDIRVGTPMNKKISGGQRKRLNIALELIREPLVLFVDEPTSGLSSKDSENVMDLLKELSLSMKLIFVVIHQPSSEIFKMFDRLYILDIGGYPIYYGNPVESILYFKHATQQINAEAGECHACGNVNPELLFSIIESKEVDDFGRFTSQRIKSPTEWNEMFIERFQPKEINDVGTLPPRTFQIPDKINQLGIFIKRDILSKAGNLQYVLISLLEAPVIAIFLTVMIRYLPGNRSHYIFRENDNIAPYIFMSIVIALFIGLTVSAEEIFRDRKILKREHFLNLSRSSYLLSKVAILFSLSAIQMFIYVIIGNSILGIKGLTPEYWLVLFSTACFANIVGLNISSAFNSAVTIYILIPLLIIPQMALGGAMFDFEKINSKFGGGHGKTPIIADVMASRWAYEGLAVTQFRNNNYERKFFDIEQIESQSNFKHAFYIPELRKIVDETASLLLKDGASKEVLSDNLGLIRNEFESEMKIWEDIRIDTKNLLPENFNIEEVKKANMFLNQIEEKYIRVFNLAGGKKDNMILALEKEKSGKENYISYYDAYYNDFLSDIVKKINIKDRIVREKDRLIQTSDPVFLMPDSRKQISFRAHFFAPEKFLFGMQINTLLFNLLAIWSMTLIFSLTLYFDVLKKLLNPGDFFRNLRASQQLKISK